MAPVHELLLLRRARTRFSVPQVLLGEILPHARGRDVSREIGGLLHDARVRRDVVDVRGSVRERAVFRIEFNVYDGIRLGSEERASEHVVLRVVFVHCSVFTVGITRVFDVLREFASG